MSGDGWPNVRHFKPKEFDSPDQPGSGFNMDRAFIADLDRLRDLCGFPLMITSGFRTASHNDEVDGVDGSAHCAGVAADIACRTSQQRMAIVKNALQLGFRRIGVGKTFIHLDSSRVHPGGVLWLYP